jgi:hypothetical protein
LAIIRSYAEIEPSEMGQRPKVSPRANLV